MAPTLLLSFLYSLGTVVVLPSPPELVLGAVASAPGWAVITVAVLGRVVGAYFVFFLGDRLKRWQRVQVWRNEARLQSWILRTEKWVNRLGAPALFFLLLIPGFPDTAMSYALSLLGRRPWAFALAVAGASALRLTLAYLGIFYVLRRA